MHGNWRGVDYLSLSVTQRDSPKKSRVFSFLVIKSVWYVERQVVDNSPVVVFYLFC